MFGGLTDFLYLCSVVKGHGKRASPNLGDKVSNFKLNHLKHNIMNKTVKTVLKILGYVIAAILGAAGEATMM